MSSAPLAALSVLLATYIPALAAPLAWHGSIELAEGRGVRGPWRQNDSRYDYVDDPTVAIDARGDISVAWVDQRRKAVLFQRFSAEGGRRGEPVDVSRLPETFSWLPRIALSPRDPRAVFVLWQEIIFSGGSHGGDILFARSRDGGRSFAAPVNLTKSVAGEGKGRISRDRWHNGSLDVAAGDDGALYAAWTAYEGPLWFTRSTDGGRTFSPLLEVAGSNASPTRAPAIAPGRDGVVYLAWTVGEDRSADIRVARSVDGGQSFAEPRVVARSEGYADAPKLVVDPNGALHVVYTEDNRRILYTRSVDAARSFEPPREISGKGAAFPHLGLDANGRLLVAWEQMPDPRRSPRGMALAVSRDGGQRFSSTPVPHSADPAGAPNGSFQGSLMRKLAVNGRGTLAIVNSSMQQGKRSRVWLVRGELRE